LSPPICGTFLLNQINHTFDAQAQRRFPGALKLLKKAAGPKAARLDSSTIEFDHCFFNRFQTQTPADFFGA
jgi:hypothetical protein